MADPRRARQRPSWRPSASWPQSYALPFDLDEARTPKGLGQLLERLKGHPSEKPLSFQLLRSLKQASYDMVNVGHFGLASQAYIHFTSPIRRYPDVVAHRRLKQRLALLGKPAGGFTAPAEGIDGANGELSTALATVAAESSFAERKAMEIEREVVDLYRAYFMRDRVGDVFEGTISAVTSFGIFVSVDEPFIEGLVRMEELGDDIFSFEESALRLVGRRSGRTFSLGDTVSVEILSVSVARRRIDFRLHGHRAEAPFKMPRRGSPARPGPARQGRPQGRAPDAGARAPAAQGRAAGRTEHRPRGQARRRRRPGRAAPRWLSARRPGRRPADFFESWLPEPSPPAARGAARRAAGAGQPVRDRRRRVGAAGARASCCG